LLTLGERADQGELALPNDLVIPDEVELRQERLLNLAQAKVVLEARAKDRDATEQAEYEAKVRAREEKARTSGRRPSGQPSAPPTSGPRDSDQYNFTDPDSRMMKNSSNAGFDHHYNVQAVVDQTHLLIVATSLSNHPNDTHEAEPELAAIPAKLGTPHCRSLGHWLLGASHAPSVGRTRY
jgi:hypothetical protein